MPFIALAFYLTCFVAWITHVVFCIKATMWVLLFLGAIIVPIGVIHGFGIWFGVFH